MDGSEGQKIMIGDGVTGLGRSQLMNDKPLLEKELPRN